MVTYDYENIIKELKRFAFQIMQLREIEPVLKMNSILTFFSKE